VRPAGERREKNRERPILKQPARGNEGQAQRKTDPIFPRKGRAQKRRERGRTPIRQKRQKSHFLPAKGKRPHDFKNPQGGKRGDRTVNKKEKKVSNWRLIIAKKRVDKPESLNASEKINVTKKYRRIVSLLSKRGRKEKKIDRGTPGSVAKKRPFSRGDKGGGGFTGKEQKKFF